MGFRARTRACNSAGAGYTTHPIPKKTRGPQVSETVNGLPLDQREVYNPGTQMHQGLQFDMTDQRPKKRGRPATGLGRDGEPSRIRDYPRLRVTVRPSTKDRLEALAQYQSRPVWKIVEDGVNLYFDKLQDESPRLAEVIARGQGNKSPLTGELDK